MSNTMMNTNKSNNGSTKPYSSSKTSTGTATTSIASSSAAAVASIKTTAGTNHGHDMTDEEVAIRNAVVPPLIMHSYHLPGYGYGADLYQYMTNNHPVFGICFHHKYHPLGFYIRIISLLGSALFGLAITNIIYLAFVFTDVNYDTTYVAVSTTNVTDGMVVLPSTLEQSVPTALSITNGNIALWTIGSAIHATYDNMIWKLAACTCCMSKDASITERQQRFQSFGTFLVMFSVVVVVALTTFAVALRNALDDNTSNNSDGLPDNVDAIETVHNVNVYKATNASNPDQVVILQEVDSTKDLEFMVAYCIELILNYFIYYPIIGLLLFSGVLGCCGKYELFGGRPYEIRKEQEADEAAIAVSAATKPSATVNNSRRK